MAITHRMVTVLMLAALLLAACAPAESAAGRKPAPGGEPTPGQPVSAAPAVTPDRDLRPIAVADARVEIGVGSPMPVEVRVSGEWPDLCAQLTAVEQQYQGRRFEFTLQAGAADPACPPDHLGLPFYMALPLNLQALPAGAYRVAVNGVETGFDWPGSGASVPADAESAGEPVPIPVSDVRVEIGVGSPIPVNVLVSGAWPGLCSRLERIEQRIAAATVEIVLLGSPNPAGCPPDAAGLPFRIAIPLNMVEMPVGAYRVRVNGVAAPFDWPARPGATQAAPAVEGAFPLVFTGPDGNLYLLEAPQAQPRPQPRPVTHDARRLQANDPAATPQPAPQVVEYSLAALSSDGRMLAYRRDIGTQVEWGMSFETGLWVTDLASGATRQALAGTPAGLAWKPGAHLLAYAAAPPEGYFARRGQVDTALAQGIQAIDLDQPAAGATVLAPPERGYTLARPVWSPDGRFLAFDEINLPEGRGLFAYYDFEAARYVPWETAIGQYAWSPDGELLAYDNLTYAPNGQERIFTRPRQAGPAAQLSPATLPGYAFQPVIAPQGDRIAYWTAKNGPDSQPVFLVVQPLDGGAPRELGAFAYAWNLAWTAGGRALIFSAGEYQAEQIFLVDAADGAQTVLATGKDPILPAR